MSNAPPIKIRSSFTPATLMGVSEEDTFLIPAEESRKQVLQKYEKLHLPAILTSKSPIGFFCCNNHVEARLQQGPTCGLVSLRMAAESIINRLPSASSDVSSSSLLQFARELGVTRSGEMFSASDMATLAEKYYFSKIQSECCSSGWDGTFLAHFLDILCNGGMALVPYDVDKNHEPCLSGGKKAHWAAVKGFVLPIFTSDQLEYAQSLCNTHSLIQLSVTGLPFFVLEPTINDTKAQIESSLLMDFSDPHSEHLLSLISQQSKSKHQGLWKYTSLKYSNHNLHHFDSERIASSIAEGQPLNVPSELSGLRGMSVFLSPA